MRDWFKSLFGKSDEEVTQHSQSGGEEDESRPLRPVIRVSPEDIKKIEDQYRNLSDHQMTLGQLQISYERKKKEILDKMDSLQDRVESEVEELRLKYGIPEDNEEYSLNLSSGEDDHGYFLRDGHGKKDVQTSNPEEKEALSRQYDNEMVVGED